MDHNKFKLPSRFPVQDRTIWHELEELQVKYDPISLGIGKSDSPLPVYISEILTSVVQQRDAWLHQYTRGNGLPRLLNVLSELYEKLTGIKYDPSSEIIVHVGASEALYCAIEGFIEPGDEVIIMEPFFFIYSAVAEMSGGVSRLIPLRAPENSSTDMVTSADWTIDFDELEKTFNSKTKMIILNTPNNPVGKVFSRLELERIAALCIKWDVICVADEVYEWLVFDDKKFERMCTLPGMKERTITVGSAGKAFCATGWRIGWAYGPKNLIRNLSVVHMHTVYACMTLIQEAVARIFELEIEKIGTSSSFFNITRLDLQERRDIVVDAFRKFGMKVFVPEGGFFIVADWTPLEGKVDLTGETDAQKDFRFVKWMIKNLGLYVVPSSNFYQPDHKGITEKYIRICFVRDKELLKKAAKKLENFKFN